MTFTITELFPTFIFESHNEVLADSLLPLCDKYTSESTTNCLHIDNFPSTLYSYGQTADVNSEPLVQEALEYIKSSCLKPFLDHRGIKLPGPLRPFGFFNTMKKGAYLRKHSHFDCFFSGIIYLDIGEDIPEISFFDPRPVTKFINYPFDTLTKLNSPLYTVKPKKGMILLWDAWLEHEVYQKKNDNSRKTFVFNI